MTRSSGSIHLLEGLSELRETLRLTGLLKGRIKDADEQRGEVWEGPKCRSFCPGGGGVSHHAGVDAFPGWKLSQPCTITLHGGGLSGPGQLLTPFPALEGGGWGRSLQASNHGLDFLGTSPHPGAHGESPR